MHMPVHTMPPALSLDMTPAFANYDFKGPHCEILCNDKPAWFKADVQGVASQVI